MRKYITCIIILFSGFGVVFVVNLQYVKVLVKNDSTKDIKTVRLTHEHGIELIENLPKGASKTIKFYSPGENSCELLVTFSNGEIIKGGGSYTEGGYKIIETIKDAEIKTELASFIL